MQGQQKISQSNQIMKEEKVEANNNVQYKDRSKQERQQQVGQKEIGEQWNGDDGEEDKNMQQENQHQNAKNQQGAVENKLSKKQIKKLKQKQKWEEMKRNKRKQQKQKQKLKKLQKIQKNKQFQQNQQKIQQVKPNQQKKDIAPQRKRKDQYKQRMLDGQKIVIDLQFYDLMTEKEQNSLCKQLAYCHSVNRKFDKAFNYIITSATEPRVKFLHEKFNILNFGITILDKDILQSFDKQKIVYLTGDAQEELTQFNPEQIYVIGGIVDHNRLKNITINYANEHGIKAKRLPMGGIKLKASVHLAVNHVWEWMLRFYNGQSWGQSIKAVIPQRKLQESQKVQNIQ